MYTACGARTSVGGGYVAVQQLFDHTRQPVNAVFSSMHKNGSRANARAATDSNGVVLSGTRERLFLHVNARSFIRASWMRLSFASRYGQRMPQRLHARLTVIGATPSSFAACHCGMWKNGVRSSTTNLNTTRHLRAVPLALPRRMTRATRAFRFGRLAVEGFFGLAVLCGCATCESCGEDGGDVRAVEWALMASEECERSLLVRCGVWRKRK